MPVCPECKNSLDAGANICNRCQTEFVFCQTQGCPLYGDPQIAKNKPCAGGCGTPLMAGRAHYVAPPPTIPPTSPPTSGIQVPQPQRPGINVEQGILDNVTIDQRYQPQAITHNYGPTETLVECRGCGRKTPERKTFRCKYCNLPNFCEDYCAKIGPNGPSFGLWCGKCPAGYPTPYQNQPPLPGHVPPPQQVYDSSSPVRPQSAHMNSQKSQDKDGSFNDEFFGYLLSKKNKLNDIHGGKTKLNGYQHIYSVQPLGMKGLYFTFRVNNDCGAVYLEIIPKNEIEANKLYDYLCAHKADMLNVFVVKGLDILPPKGAKSSINVKCKESCIGNYKDRSQWERMTDEMIRDMRNLEDATIPWLKKYFSAEK
jgi:hypothetical protein